MYVCIYRFGLEKKDNSVLAPMNNLERIWLNNYRYVRGSIKKVTHTQHENIYHLCQVPENSLWDISHATDSL